MSDLISRQAAIEKILECCPSDFDNEYECGYDDGLRQAVHRLKHLQSAQPARKTGKWTLNKDGNWACPFCEFDPYHDNMKGMNYCPNCGARLKMPLADCGARMDE